MTRSLQKVGNSKGLVMTRTMLEHLGVTDAVEVLIEEGRIVITARKAPRRAARVLRRRRTPLLHSMMQRCAA